MPELLDQLKAGEPQAAEEISKFSELKFKALIAENPYIEKA